MKTTLKKAMASFDRSPAEPDAHAVDSGGSLHLLRGAHPRGPVRVLALRA